MNDLKVCSWPIRELIPYARNSRKIPERAIDKVAASINEFGWRVPIVVDQDGVIICGHTRLARGEEAGPPRSARPRRRQSHAGAGQERTG